MIERDKNIILPDWYRGWFYQEDNKLDDRPIEYVYYAIKNRPILLSMIKDNFKFCLENPETNMRKLNDCIADILKKFKQLKFDEK